MSNRKVAFLTFRLNKVKLAPFVGGGWDAFIDDGVESGALLDEDFRKLAILAKENGLEAD